MILYFYLFVKDEFFIEAKVSLVELFNAGRILFDKALKKIFIGAIAWVDVLNCIFGPRNFCQLLI